MAGSEIIGKEELQEIKKVFDKNPVNLYRYGGGNYAARKLEEKISNYFSVKYSHVVSSGTAAIHCALAGAGIGPGDEVITTAFTFLAPIETICSLGAVPVIVDINETFNLNPDEVEKAITNKTKAILSIPMWSAPDMGRLVNISKKHNIMLIEDSAQSLGASYKSKKIGTFGSVASFSFDAGKTLHTGEGGVVITNDKDIYDRVAEFSDHGHMHVEGLPRGKDPRRKPGLNYRMSEVTAAIGIAQFNKLDFILERCTRNKYLIKDKLKNFNNITFRKFDDEKGAQGDTLIFSLKNRKMAIEFEKRLNDFGYSTKILPEAMEWHFAGSWSHLIKSIDIYKYVDLESKYEFTGELLRRSICINIQVNFSEEDCLELADKIFNILSEDSFN